MIIVTCKINKTKSKKGRQPSLYERIMDSFPSHWDQHSFSGWHLLFSLTIFTLSFSDLSSHTLLFIFLLKEHFLHVIEGLCSSASECRFRTGPQSCVSHDKHHWPLGRHLKSTLHLDSSVLALTVTRRDIGSFKSRKPPVQNLFLRVSPLALSCLLPAF